MNYSAEDRLERWDNGSFGDIDHSEIRNSTSEDEDSFWTKERLMIINSFPPHAFFVMGLIISAIAVFGLIANGTVLFIFSRFKRLRSPPANTFIMNLAFSDFAASTFHFLSAYSNFNGRWAFGSFGCQLYGMAIGFFGLVSILTFSAIACERCLVIACPIVSQVAGLADGRWKITRAQAKKVCVFIWLHCGILVMLPFFGWSSYVPEGLLTSCSWDYTTRTASNRSYYVLLLTTGFLIPVIVICASYGRIMSSVVANARQMVCINKHSSAFRKLRRQTEIRTAQIVVTLILVYLTAWTPYAIVTLIGQFGPEDAPLSPTATAIPAYFAKTAVVLDPLVYGFSHPHFRISLKHYISSVMAVQNSKNISSIQQNHSSINRQTHPGKSIYRQQSGGSYPSRAMTIYPSGCYHSQEYDPYSVLQRYPTDVGGRRRMLRTFHNLTQSQAANVSVSTRGVQTSVKTTARDGVVELCHSYMVAVTSISTEREGVHKTVTFNNGSVETGSPKSPKESLTKRQLQSDKEKNTEVDYHTEDCVNESQSPR